MAFEVANPSGLPAPPGRPVQNLSAADKQLRMMWCISTEIFMHVACVTKQTYDSMHKPTVEQLFQVSQALSCFASSPAEWRLFIW